MITDKPTRAIVDKLHPKVRAEVTKIVEEVQSKPYSNAIMRLTQGLGTIEYQNSLHAQGRTTKGVLLLPMLQVDNLIITMV